MFYLDSWIGAKNMLISERGGVVFHVMSCKRAAPVRRSMSESTLLLRPSISRAQRQHGASLYTRFTTCARIVRHPLLGTSGELCRSSILISPNTLRLPEKPADHRMGGNMLIYRGGVPFLGGRQCDEQTSMYVLSSKKPTIVLFRTGSVAPRCG